MLIWILAAIGFLFALLTGTLGYIVGGVIIIGLVMVLGPFIIHLGIILIIIFLIIGFLKYLSE